MGKLGKPTEIRTQNQTPDELRVMRIAKAADVLMTEAKKEEHGVLIFQNPVTGRFVVASSHPAMRPSLETMVNELTKVRR